jgi:plastocyanin
MTTLLLTTILALAAGPSSPAPATATVHIKDFAYIPATLTVSNGAMVHFVNDDSEAHTVTAVNNAFDSGGLDTGDVWDHRFATPGTFAYFCRLHPFMHGTIVVRN